MTTSRAAAAVKVYVNGELDTSFRPLVIEETIGGANLDYAVLESDSDKHFKSLDKVELIEAQDETIEISIDQTIGGKRDHFVHFGQISKVEPILHGGGEGIRYISRTERFHFGKPLTTIRVHSPSPTSSKTSKGTTIDVDWDMIFNPIVDGKVTGSRSPHRDGDRGASFAFISPESVANKREQDLHGGAARFWDLTEAVYAVCKTLNTGTTPFDTTITNPSRKDLFNVFSPDDLLRNVRIKPGQYLPDILAKLAEPFGYSWYLERSLGRRQIKFFRKGITGDLVPLKLQAAGESVDVTKSNVKKFNVVFDKTQLANQVTVIGSKIRAEFTAELHRGWKSQLDGLGLEDLTNHEIEEHPERKNVYRKYVLNESGAYNGLRTSITEAFSWEYVFDARRGAEIPGKREAFATLTLNPETMRAYGNVGGIHVEMTNADFDPYKPWLPTGWTVASAKSCQILRDEIGVYFNGAFPPETLVDGGKVRITCSVESDHRVKVTAKRRATSPQPNVVELVLIAPESFQYNQIRLAGPNKSVLDSKSLDNGTPFPTLEKNDFEAAAKYAKRVRETFDAVKGKGRIVLEGIDQGTYTLGKRIEKIEGIGLGLQMNKGAALAIYPFIAALRFDIDKQETTITIDQLRKTPRNADR